MRAIILAGGNGTRLYPSTIAVSKQLLPVYNKPMIYYPMSTIMLAGIRDILLITKPEDTSHFHNLLGDGSDLGISLNYAVQTTANGIPEALSIGRHFLGMEQALLVLGDNILFGTGLTPTFNIAKRALTGSAIFSYAVADPERYGIVELNKDLTIKGICEKPKRPKSKLAITGHYMLANDSIERVRELKKSERGETEIIDLLKSYLKENALTHYRFGRGFAWFDSGTHSSLLEASRFVAMIERRQGYMIACLEEIALNNGWLDGSHVEELARTKYTKTAYGSYLLDMLKETA
ncbi:MAG: glucose-1-phosphate thymidylyltransferase RfbA [Paracoccaceae bacterium]